MTQSAIGAPAPPANKWATDMLQEACAHAGLDPAGARLVKFTNNAVFILDRAPITVRIAGSAAVGDRVPKILAVARWLADHQVPAVRVAEDIRQPVNVNGLPVTFWHTVTTPADAPKPTGHDLGRILRRIHELPSPSVLPPWNPLRGIRKRLADQEILTASELQFLTDTCDELGESLTQIRYTTEPASIHGDAFLGNLIPSHCGPIICDFDSAAQGPREWDLTPVAVGALRFNYSSDLYPDLVRAYGRDILAWSGFATLRRLRELQLVTSVLPVLPSNRSLTEQWRHRFTSFQKSDPITRWSPYV